MTTYQVMMISRTEPGGVADHVSVLLHVDELVLIRTLQDDNHFEIKIRSVNN